MCVRARACVCVWCVGMCAVVWCVGERVGHCEGVGSPGKYLRGQGGRWQMKRNIQAQKTCVFVEKKIKISSEFISGDS